MPHTPISVGGGHEFIVGIGNVNLWQSTKVKMIKHNTKDVTEDILTVRNIKRNWLRTCCAHGGTCEIKVCDYKTPNK